MKVIADLSVIPLGVGVSVSEYVVACERVLARAGLRPRIHAAGTEIEGEWDEVFDAVKRCHEVVHGMGASRLHSVLKLSTSTDREESIAHQVESVACRL